MLHHLLVHEEALPSPDTVHVDLGSVGGVRLLAEVHQLLLGCRQPEGIDINHL